MSHKDAPALAAHALATDRTAIYPHAGTGTVPALAYVALGLGGEASEALEKDALGDPAGLVTELGDTLWYIARFHRELGLEPATTAAAAALAQPVVPAALTALVVSAGRVQELVKKAVRDDESSLTTERRAALESGLVLVLASWLAVHAGRSLDPAQTAAANIAKLADRRSRRVLAGSGDHR